MLLIPIQLGTSVINVNVSEFVFTISSIKILVGYFNRNSSYIYILLTYNT